MKYILGLDIAHDEFPVEEASKNDSTALILIGVVIAVILVATLIFLLRKKR
ncbi:MAG: LPXTG cell wall anchor domain-containing protein [Erysipelotrichaceae bacterium]|jgi:LPXTG-motif cell wall-anchored protein|nr:LPXTG cell wall anchor domain-containing protein [Erysipelotrichaceae bacterium]